MSQPQPFHDRDGFIWQDGVLRPWREANVHILTHALHYAGAVFEGERAYGGVIFKSRLHSERLHNSARILGYKVPFSVEEIDAAKQEVLKANGLVDGYIRALAWRGSEMMGVAAQNNKIHLAIAAWAWGAYFAGELKGIRLTMADWRRPAPDTAPSQAKASGLYMIATMSKHAAEAKGYADAMMLDYRGQIAEATGANAFFVKDGKVHTPTPDCFLNGLTRQTVIDILRHRQIEVVERAILPNELESFEQCFLTGSAAEVTPVAEIGPYNYEVGALTRQVVQDYADLVRGKISI
ncbi:branched-chain amino acid aminotransferase [Neomegalonema sp.]|uniref:branched-chain amino acid aminotransferase n=1 Tax=Neomegalonema sp. TaxID=2039713 RepID=UPI0026313F6A|nr:branched-chain amino acid aminotransferase [Neomegalonema sp.]MDD2867626.1 branched-chain amino acid aminotransferase [Neomegalonema sp.]